MSAPKTAVFAWDLFALYPPERWYKEAEAFADSAFELFCQMSDSSRTHFVPNWPRAKVAAFVFAHGLELFLKAAIAQAGRDFPRGHDLDQLFRTYCNTFKAERFAFESDVARFVSENQSIPFYMFLKYPEEIDDVGKTWNASINIDVGIWKTKTVAFLMDIRRLWPLIVEKYPTDPARWQRAEPSSIDG